MRESGRVFKIFFGVGLRWSAGSAGLFFCVQSYSLFQKLINHTALFCSVTLSQRDTYSVQETHGNITYLREPSPTANKEPIMPF